jgi:hypothetical protein
MVWQGPYKLRRVALTRYGFESPSLRFFHCSGHRVKGPRGKTMINPNGNIVLNGITDQEMVRIWEFKAKNPNAFNFNPQQFQVTPHPGGGYYSNVTFHWNGEVGLQVMHQIISYLLKKEEKAEAAGQ